MTADKEWPQPGDRLVHRFRKKEGEVVAEVVSVDLQTGKVAVRVGVTTHASLSGAAQAITGVSTNGWVFWGLKKQVNRPPARDATLPQA